MTNTELQTVADAAARRAVQDMLLTLGVDTSDPDAVIGMQADFRHLRAWRKSTEAVKHKALLSAVGFIVVAVLGWLLVAFGLKAAGLH